MFKRNKSKEQDKVIKKVIEIESEMTGDLKFSTPVNLKINSKFKGTLETKGTLIIGEKAEVNAKTIQGEDINIFGKVTGDVISSTRLKLAASARVTGKIKTPVLIVDEGALVEGICQVPSIDEKVETKKIPKRKSKMVF